MQDSVYKIVELTGSSKTSTENAIQNAIDRAGESLRNLNWFEVVETRGYIENNRVAYWQVTIKVGFNVDDASSTSKEKGENQLQKQEKEKSAEKETQKKQTKSKKQESEKDESKAKPKKEGLAKYRCTVCGYVYDPEKGDPTQEIKPETSFEDLPDSWKCPECGVGKDKFEKI